MAAPGVGVWVGGFALVVMAGCSAETEPASDVETASEFGITDEDVVAMVENRNAATQACMEERGFEYVPQALSQQVVWDGDRPGWGMAYSALQIIRGDDGGSAASSRAPVQLGYQDAAEACLNQVMEEERARSARVHDSQQVLERAWERFRASEEYEQAAREWSGCMAEAGHDIAWPDQASGVIAEAMTNAQPPSGSWRDADEQVVVALLEREVALREASDGCRAETVDPVEQEFKGRLFREQAEAVTAVRRAQRGD